MQLGVWQLLLILAVVLIFFGAGKLPRVMGDVGKGMRNLRKGLQDDSDTQEEITPSASLQHDKTDSVAKAEHAEKKRHDT